MGTCVSTESKSSDSRRITATFPGDPDHGKVVYEEAPKRMASRKSFCKKRTQCFLDIAIDDEPAGRIIIDLRTDVNPRTCENFRALCTGEQGLSYKECKFHRIIPNFVLQTGDVELKTQKKEGKGGVSIYGRSFADEDMDKLRHDYGMVSMANCGPHTNNSQFMIVTDPDGTEWLDGKHTVFGRVSEESYETLKAIEDCVELFDRGDKQRARVKKKAVIADCGEL